MTGLILDRQGRYAEPPPFLACIGRFDRSWRRLVAFVPLAALAAGACALLVTLGCLYVAASRLAATSGVSVGAAFSTLTAGGRVGPRLTDYWYELSVAGLGSLAAAVALVLVAKRVFHRPARSFLTSAGRFRGSLVLGGIAAGLVTVGAAILIERLWSADVLHPPLLTTGEPLNSRIAYAGMALLFLGMAALAEEIIFRGWLLQQVSAWTRSIPVLLAINGVVFSFVHFDPDPSAFLVRCVMGAGWAWIALRTGGVEFTTGAHLANNLLVSLFVTPVSFAASVSRDLDLRAVALELAIVLLLVAIVEVWLRRTRGAAQRALPNSA